MPYKAHLDSLLAGAGPSPPCVLSVSVRSRDGRRDADARDRSPSLRPVATCRRCCSSPPPSAPLPPLPASGGLPPFAWTWRSTLLPPAAPPPAPPSPVALVPKHLQEDEQFLSVFRAQQARQSGAALANLREAAAEEEEYPHVYQATKTSGLKGLSYGGRLALPMGTVREEWPVRRRPPPATPASCARSSPSPCVRKS